uniref:ORF2 n=1 Tax=Torque teno virus TaxID=68887 RepID=Q2F828_9VIRU|nr:ORF2 [Torque teno virus]ABD34287.1 ORF2 [Torque teno virus]
MGKALRVFILNMRFSRIYKQKKRPLPLLLVRVEPKALASDMSWRPPVHNAAGIERQLLEGCFRFHAACCGCGSFITHLTILATRYGFTGGPAPPGGPGALPSLRRALPAPAAPENQPEPELWRGRGGGGDGNAGGRAEGGDGGDFAPEELDELFRAVAADEE